MKKVLFSIAISLSALGLMAQSYQNLYGLFDKNGKMVITPIYEDLKTSTEGLIAAQYHGLWGFLDQNGKWVITPQFSDASRFSHGLAAVKIGETFNYFGDYDKCGYIDRSGAWVITLPKGYYVNWLSDFKTNGQAMIIFVDGDDQYWRFIDRDGNISESSSKPSMEPAEPKPTLVAFEGENKKYGFKNTAGKVVIEPKYDFASSEKEGLALVKVGDNRGFIDGTGKIVIEPRADISGNSFSNGYGILKQEGRPLPFTFTPSGKYYYKGFSYGVAPFRIKKDGLWGLINQKGEVLIEPYYKNMTIVGPDGYLSALDGNSNCWQVFDKDGIHALSVESDVTPIFSDGLAAVCQDGGLYGYIDIDGKWVIAPNFSYASEFYDGIAVVRDKDNNHRYINKSGRYILGANYDIARDFNGDLATVRVGDLWGVIDRSGKYMVEPKYTDCGFYSAECGWGQDANGTNYYFNDSFEREMSWFLGNSFKEDYNVIALRVMEYNWIVLRVMDYRDKVALILEDKITKKQAIYVDGGYDISDEYDGFGSIHGDWIEATVGGKWTFVSLKTLSAMTPMFDYVGNYYGTGPIMVWYDKMWRPLDIDKVAADHRY